MIFSDKIRFFSVERAEKMCYIMNERQKPPSYRRKRGRFRMIYWFSGTGNSLFAARRIAAQTQDTAISMSDALKNGISFSARETRLGLVFPVYFYGLPSVVSDFIDALDISCSANTYVYAVITCGGSIGNAGGVLRRKLHEKHIPLTAIYTVKMPDNYILMYDLPDDGTRDALIEDAKKELNAIAQSVLSARSVPQGNRRGPLPHLLSGVLAPLYNAQRHTKSFRVDGNCIGCGLCAQNCPIGAIEIQNGKPVWIKDQCALCLRCLHHCPKSAIQFGSKTASRRRYRFPEEE